jgi:tetratricopeptide (TPR) repeat protein
MTNDPNLLFAVLALQMAFVKEEDLLAAMTAWARDQSARLSDILVDRHALNPKRRALIEAMVQEQLEEHDGDVGQSLGSLGSAKPLREMISRIVDAELQATLTDALDSAPTEAKNFASPDHPSGTRFVILRPHAKGGLGEVFVAKDQELNRVVALKEIQARFKDDESCRARFVQEAEVTGCLEHPAIVPIYAFGRYEDGRPYYAMRFIEGETFKHAIDQFHGTTQLSAGERVLALRKLLGAFLTVCQAVHYAHTRGVLHRDLKPDNVMVGRFGETLVVDWGLAKPLRTVEEEAADSSAASGQQRATPMMAGSPKTIAGTAMGTPAFMSPEQAAGRLDELSPATDVYGLGATLHYLLTGQAAFGGSDVAAVRQRVVTGDFPRPRTVRNQVPPALEAICLKAMALRPGERYSSAQELANDIEQWLADEPVRAYREPWLPRLARWARRHRPLVVGAAVLLIAAVIGLSAGIVAVNREKERTVQEQHKTAQALEAESKARQRARQALDEMSSQVTEDWLARRADLEPAQKAFLEKTLAYYEAFAAESGDREDLRSAVANANLRSAMMRHRLGQLTDAERASRRGRELFEQLTHEFPDVADYRRALADCNHELANVLRERNHFEEAETVYRSAIDLRRQLAADFPAEPNYRQGLGRTLYGLASLLRIMDRRKLAEPIVREAITIQEQLVGQPGRERSDRPDLARSYDGLAVILAETGRPADAEKTFLVSLAAKQRLSTDFPSEREFRYELGLAHYNLSRLLSVSKQSKALTELGEAVTIFNRLSAEFPSVPDYRYALANTQGNRARVYEMMKKTQEAERDYRAALAVRERLAADFPEQPKYREELVNGYRGLGIHLLDAGQPKEAEAALNQALAIGEGLVRAYPRQAAYAELVSGVSAMQAVLWAGTGDHTRAVAMATKIEASPNATAAIIYDLACACSRSVAAVRRDSKLSSAEQAKLAEEYGSRAVRLCSLALAKERQKGFARLPDLSTDADFDPIRSRADFRKLLQTIHQRAAEKPANGSNPKVP